MTSIEELRRQLDAAYAAISEIDDDLAAGRVGTEDHAELKKRSERQAAVILKRLRDAEESAASPRARQTGGPAGTTPSRTRSRSPIALVLAGVALLVFGVVLGVLVTRFASDDRAAAAAAMSGAGSSDAPPAAPPSSPKLDALARTVEPADAPTAKILEFAQAALDEGRVPAAIAAYKRVLDRDPKNVDAITHVAVILAQGGHVDRAIARLDEAIRLDPTYAPAYWSRGRILFDDKKDYPAAARSLETFVKLAPGGEDAARARTMLAEARKQTGSR